MALTSPLRHSRKPLVRSIYIGESGRYGIASALAMQLKRHSATVWNTSEALDRTDVIRSATRWGAEYVLKERELGTLETGKRADLIILDREFMTIPVEDVSKTNVLMTMAGGKVVFQKRGFVSSLVSAIAAN